MSVQRVPKDAVALTPVTPYTHEQDLPHFNLTILQLTKYTYIVNLRLQERILDIPRRVQEGEHESHQLNFSDEFELVRRRAYFKHELNQQVAGSTKATGLLGDKMEIVDDVFDDIFRKHSESHRHLLWQRDSADISSP